MENATRSYDASTWLNDTQFHRAIDGSLTQEM